MEERKYVVGGLVVLGILLLIFTVLYYNIFQTAEQTKQNIYKQAFLMTNPIDIVLDFYNPWLEAVKSTTTDPYALGFTTEKILSKELSDRLLSTKGHSETEIDPVLCQTTTPQQITGRIVSQQEDTARVLVVAKEKELTGQSVFTLRKHNDSWFIDSILCSPGEFELVREFSFDKEGYLLKSVLPPLDPLYWHLVFEENDELGHAVPLFFNTESSCISMDKNEAKCTPDQFTEATKVHIYGQMTERGVETKRLEFLE